LYKLEQLEKHVKTSHRILNDLRTLRRLLFEERAGKARMVETEPSKVDVQESGQRSNAGLSDGLGRTRQPLPKHRRSA